MATKINLYRNGNSVGRRQLPITSDNLMMLMDLSNRGLSIDSPPIRGKDMEEFTRKYNLLTPDELRQSLEIDSTTFLSVLNQCVQCVGCRRRVERLFKHLISTGYPTLDPLVFKASEALTLTDEKMSTASTLGTMLYRHHDILNNVLDNKLRNKTRCVMHSMDAFRAKPFSETWREVWASMKHNCRDEITIIEMKELHDVLETYLKKHKFCQGCREKIEKAYKILVGEITCKDKGYVAALYANIRKCQEDKHVHIINTKMDFLDALIRRAEPEVNGNSFSKHRERHAKTLEIAQEEVLTCVGMILYERLRRIYINLREEERACQVLAAVGVHSLCRSFDMAVEKKQGISNLELLYQEISRAEKAKEIKRELKKLKKKQKKNEKKNSHRCDSINTVEADDEPDEAVDVSGDNELDDAIDADINDGEECTGLLKEDEVEICEDHAPAIVQCKKKQKQSKKQIKKKDKKKSQGTAISKSNTANLTLSLTSPVIDLSGKCEECFEPTTDCPCDVKDSGYGSEANSNVNSRMSSAVSSPDGSEVSCSDGFCNHEQSNANDLDDHDHVMQQDGSENYDCEQRCTLSLQQMLNDIDEYENEDEEHCYIPPEVVLQYQRQQEKVQLERKKLRETLKQNFARLCMEKGFVPAE